MLFNKLIFLNQTPVPPVPPTPTEIDILKDDCKLTNYMRLSNAVGDGMSCAGRTLTRTSNEPILMFAHYHDQMGGYTVASANSSLAYTASSNGSLAGFYEYTPTNGRKIYIAELSSRPSGAINEMGITTDGESVTIGVIYGTHWKEMYYPGFDGTYAAAAMELLRRFSVIVNPQS